MEKVKKERDVLKEEWDKLQEEHDDLEKRLESSKVGQTKGGRIIKFLSVALDGLIGSPKQPMLC